MKVSVVMISYNHERFIRQALDSALAQEAAFEWEIVIGDDCSKDATPQIIREYQQRHPERIRILHRDENIGAVRNFHMTLAAARGEYAAILEGDDYWTNPHKLAKQVAFLDSHPDYAICFHNVRGVVEGGQGQDFDYCPPGTKPTIELNELLQENVIPTCSAMFRRWLIPHYPAWLLDLKMGDYPLHLLNARYGKAGYLNEMMGVYRVHSAGLWTNLTRIQRVEANVTLYSHLEQFLPAQYKQTVRNMLAALCWELAHRYEAVGDRSRARRYFLRSLRAQPTTGGPSTSNKAKTLARFFAPWLYHPVVRSRKLLQRHPDQSARNGSPPDFPQGHPPGHVRL